MSNAVEPGLNCGFSGLLMPLPFFVQPLVIALERRLGVRHRPELASRLWTVSVLFTLLPLIAAPLLRIAASTWPLALLHAGPG